MATLVKFQPRTPPLPHPLPLFFFSPQYFSLSEILYVYYSLTLLIVPVCRWNVISMREGFLSV